MRTCKRWTAERCEGGAAAASSESLGIPLSFCRWRFRPSADCSVFGLRLSLLLRIGCTCLIVAVLEDDHLHPLTAELFCFCQAGHVDVDVMAVHLSTSVFHGIVAGISASAINADAAVEGQYPSVGGHTAWMRPLAGSARALHRIRSGNEVADGGPSTPSRRGRLRRGGRQKCKSNQRGEQYSQNGSLPQVRCNDSQSVTQGWSLPLPAFTPLRIRGTTRAESNSALAQSVVLQGRVPHFPLPLTPASAYRE